jgi:penicillin-binding protein 2
MRLFQPDTRQRRTLGAIFAITFVITILLTAFFQTQVVSGHQFALRSEENRLRPINIPAPRGTIYDRNGEIVATSITGYSVSLLPSSAATIEQTLTDLEPFLGLARTDIDRLIAQRNARPHDILTITEDATYSQVAAIEERRAAFPNLIILERPKRYYPAGPAIAHMIGYVAEISREELADTAFARAGYRQGRWIGKAGIEREYELQLGGTDGARFVEVDAMGRIVNPNASVGQLAPRPGNDIKLTIDLELQKYISQIFPDTMNGAVVAMVPSTGEILALYSHPGYDPNDFVGGIPLRVWRALNQDPRKPLLDRTINALYPPASTFKVVIAEMAVSKGIAHAGTHMPIACTGGLFYAGRYARCWLKRGHGSLDLASAIEQSCNVYFYQLGIQLGLKEITERGTRIGFNRRTGIDLPGERTPIFPTSVEWYQKRFGHTPTPSEVLSLAIGQGPNSQSVLSMAHFYSAIAGNGNAPEPHLVDTPHAGEGEGTIELDVGPTQLEAVWDGLIKVTQPGGTAWLSALERWPLYGKTGTAQNPQGADHGWFVGFSGPPGGHPEIAVAAIIEKGLHGSDVSPMVAKVVNYYLDRTHNLPFDAQPTLIERWETQRKPWGQTDTYPALLTPASAGGAQTVASAPKTR